MPVEPEVYKMNNGSSASTISRLQNWLDFSSKGWSQRSRPSFMYISEFILFATSTVSTQGVCSSASSTIPFRSMVLAPRYDPSAVITILHSASLILVASAIAENPANTTEWTAPILAQAKRATARSGIIGMYIQTRSPFSIPWSFSALANLHTLSWSW